MNKICSLVPNANVLRYACIYFMVFISMLINHQFFSQYADKLCLNPL